MPERVLKLAKEISKISEQSIDQILNVTKRTRLLAINAQIESAHAGEIGKGFNVVAEEVKKVSAHVQEISQRMTTDLEGRLHDLQQLGQILVSQVRGTRLGDLALNMIEIIDRNLYERSCDVRWWATDSAMVDALQQPSTATAQHCSKRLGVILSSYTVYLDLWVADADGRVIANGRPDRYRDVIGSNVKSEKWFRQAMATRSGGDFVALDIERIQRLANRPVATYATAIRANASETGKPIGALGIFFDWEEQAKSVVEGVRISDDERDRTRALLIDSNHRVIASNPRIGILSEKFPLSPPAGLGNVGNYEDGNGNVVGFALTPGYETYRGLGWYGVLVQRL